MSGQDALEKALEAAERWPMMMETLRIFSDNHVSGVVRLVDLLNRQRQEHRKAIVEFGDRLTLIANRLGTSCKIAGCAYPSATSASKSLTDDLITMLWNVVDFLGATDALMGVLMGDDFQHFDASLIADSAHWDKCQSLIQQFISERGDLEAFRNLAIAVSRERVELLHSVKTSGVTDKDDTGKKKTRTMPDNPDVRDLCKLLSDRKPGVSMNEVARKFTGELENDFPKAKSLLRQARRFQHLWKADT